MLVDLVDEEHEHEDEAGHGDHREIKRDPDHNNEERAGEPEGGVGEEKFQLPGELLLLLGGEAGGQEVGRSGAVPGRGLPYHPALPTLHRKQVLSKYSPLSRASYSITLPPMLTQSQSVLCEGGRWCSPVTTGVVCDPAENDSRLQHWVDIAATAAVHQRAEDDFTLRRLVVTVRVRPAV